MKKGEILERLNEITKSYSFLYILGRIIIRDFTGSIDILFSHNNMEHLNHREFAFLMGLWLKNVDISNHFDTETEIKVFNEVYHLMDQLHKTFIEHFVFDSQKKYDSYEHFANGKAFQETMFYSGTGAYDNQYRDLVTLKYKYDKNWFKKSKSFEIESLPKFYDNIKNVLQNKLNKRKFTKNLSDREQIISLLCLSKKEIIEENNDFENILDCLKVDINESNNEKFNDLGDFNIYNEKPIIKIDKNIYFIPSAFALSESIYESPFYWMLNDKEYQSTALKNRGDVAEEITSKLLEPVFGINNVYQNVIINKNKNEQISDIDILAVYQNKAIIFQVKSKKLTALSKNGDFDSIKKDFKKAVQDAYEQGVICKKCLINHQDYKFPFQDVNFINKINKIHEYNIVTIVLDDYPAITHQVHILLGNKTEELPVAINIFDLELVAKYLPKPGNFIDYISRRTKYSKLYKADNEMAYLGFHLDRGLTKHEADYAVLDYTWAQLIDRKYYNELYKEKINKFSMKKLQRNDPCLCHSGLKYKKCHGKIS